MSKIINISEKLDNTLSSIQIGDRTYPVRDDVTVVTKFEEMASAGTLNSIVEAIEMSIGKNASKEIKLKEMSFKKLRVISIAVFAAMLDLEYDEAESRFLGRNKE